MPDNIKHGTEYGWKQCRQRPQGACKDCKEAKYAAWRRSMNKGVPDDAVHGTWTTYRHGCGCGPCIQAARDAWNRQKRQQRARPRQEAVD